MTAGERRVTVASASAVTTPVSEVGVAMRVNVVGDGPVPFVDVTLGGHTATVPVELAQAVMLGIGDALGTVARLVALQPADEFDQLQRFTSRLELELKVGHRAADRQELLAVVVARLGAVVRGEGAELIGWGGHVEPSGPDTSGPVDR